MIKVNLGAVMADRLITASEVSKITGISRTTLTSLKRRKAKGVTFETLNKLCEALNCDLSDLLQYIPDEEATK